MMLPWSRRDQAITLTTLAISCFGTIDTGVCVLFQIIQHCLMFTMWPTVDSHCSLFSSSSSSLLHRRVPHEPSRPSPSHNTTRSRRSTSNQASSAEGKTKSHSVSPRAVKVNKRRVHRPSVDNEEGEASDRFRKQLWNVLWRQLNQYGCPISPNLPRVLNCPCHVLTSGM
jgi:hypothetical protein